MDKIKTLLIRLVGNLIYLLINKFQSKEIILLDTCFNSVEDGDIGIVYNYFKYDYQVIVVKNNKSYTDKNEINKKSLKYYYYLSKSKLLVTNNAHHLYSPKNKKTNIISTWHGTPYKDVSISKFSTYILQFMNRNTTAHISGNKYFEQKYLNETINFKGQVLRNGFFRNDILLKDSSYYDKYDFCQNGKENILICPTWREYGEDKLVIEIKQLIEQLNIKFSSRYNILIRMHNKSKLSTILDPSLFYNVSDKEYEIQKLLTITDILITDYSSVFFDFALREKPIILFQFDEIEYKIKRGLLIDDIAKEYGMNVIRQVDNILYFLDNLDLNFEKKKIIEFNDRIGQYELGDSIAKIKNFTEEM